MIYLGKQSTVSESRRMGMANAKQAGLLDSKVPKAVSIAVVKQDFPLPPAGLHKVGLHTCEEVVSDIPESCFHGGLSGEDAMSWFSGRNQGSSRQNRFL